MEFKKNGVPSLDIWTGQSRTSTPSDMALLYAKLVQARWSPLAPYFEITKVLSKTWQKKWERQVNNYASYAVVKW